MFTPSEEIKNKLNIVDVIGGYLRLQKAGVNYKALCPFHKEKTPSFFVSPSRQIWHCFGGCSEGGDIFKFVMKIEGVDFPEALKILAARAGVKLKKQDPKLVSQRSKLYDICEEAAQFFQDQLNSKFGKEVTDYLKERGINDESIKDFRIGYTLDEWRNLLKHLTELGYNILDIEKAGLIIRKSQIANSGSSYNTQSATRLPTPDAAGYGGQVSDKDYYDRFRGRIMFPIADINGRIVGFTGRVFESQKSDVAKYVNSPQTLIYDKSRILYGLDKAKVEIRKQNQCIVVEGNTDLILSHQVGVKNVVASSGTALTLYQLSIIKRYTPNLLISFDMDLAGDIATKRGINLAQKEGFNIKILILPEGKDPADYIKEKGKEWQELINQGVSIYEFYIQSAFSKLDKNTPEGKKEISFMVFPLLKNIPNKIEQAYWIRELADKLNTKEEYVMEELAKFKDTSTEEQARYFEPIPTKTKKSRQNLLEERLLTMILRNKEKIKNIAKEDFPFFTIKTQNVLEFLRKKHSSKNKSSQEISDFLNYLELFSQFKEEEYSKIDTEKEIDFCLSQIRILRLKEKLEDLNREIQEAEKRGDEEKLEGLIKEFHDLGQKIHSLLSDINY